MKKNSQIKLGCQTTLKELVLEIADALEVEQAILVRAILWDRLLQVKADLQSKKEIVYNLVLSRGRESLSKTIKQNKQQ